MIPTPAQSLNITLGGQVCRIVVRQLSTGLFIDLYVSDTLIIGGVICENDNRIVRNTYLGFIGDLYFHDTLPPPGGLPADPYWTSLGVRWLLLWLDPAVDG